MSTLVIYYTFSGRTKVIAEDLAATEPADIVQIKDAKHLNKLKAYTAGIVASIRGKPWNILPLDADFSKYDNLILLSPVWASNPPPAVNAMLEQLPSGKSVSVKMVSRSGQTECRARMEALIENKGSILGSFEDVKVSN